MELPDGVKEIRGGAGLGRQYPHGDVTEAVIGCAIAVHKALHAGYVEGVYENAMVHELSKSGCRVERQKAFQVHYDGVQVGEHRADLLVDGKVVVELKAVAGLTDRHVSQVMSTMKAAGVKVGLLINFHEARLIDGVRRIVM